METLSLSKVYERDWMKIKSKAVYTGQLLTIEDYYDFGGRALTTGGFDNFMPGDFLIRDGHDGWILRSDLAKIHYESRKGSKEGLFEFTPKATLFGLMLAEETEIQQLYGPSVVAKAGTYVITDKVNFLLVVSLDTFSASYEVIKSH